MVYCMDLWVISVTSVNWSDQWNVVPWCSVYCTALFSKAWTEVLCRCKYCLEHAVDLWWWEPLAMSQLEIRVSKFHWSAFPENKLDSKLFNWVPWTPWIWLPSGNFHNREFDLTLKEPIVTVFVTFCLLI